jgi:hypothetical protein
MGTVRFMYLRDERRKPVACVAMRRDGNNVLYQLSTAHPKDQFDKKLARTIAVGRLEDDPVVLNFEEELTSGHLISSHVMQDVLDNSTARRAIDGAKNWLDRNAR